MPSSIESLADIVDKFFPAFGKRTAIRFDDGHFHGAGAGKRHVERRRLPLAGDLAIRNPNDVLARLHVAKLRVIDVPVRAVYGPAWKSGIKLHHVIYPVAFALLRSWRPTTASKSRSGIYWSA